MDCTASLESSFNLCSAMCMWWSYGAADTEGCAGTATQSCGCPFLALNASRLDGAVGADSPAHGWGVETRQSSRSPPT